MSPGDLEQALCGFQFPVDENLLIGLESPDDAGVYKISDEIAMIQSVDFFTPIVDDPYQFGQIAAANALSDIYAMGGVPKTAMNLIGFPIREMEISVLRRILQGGIDKLNEARVVLVGGHSIEDRELKYGLSVTGFVHPDQILTNRHYKAGDRFILTKPLGVGIINTAIKGRLASPQTIDSTVRLMTYLNKDAAQVMKDYPVHACTDITGFGLLGHLAEMVTGSGLSVEIETSRVPIIKEAKAFAAMGLVPAGAYKNREFCRAMMDMPSPIDPIVDDILFDPQTSGGLLIGVDEKCADELTDRLRNQGMSHAAIIGRALPEKTTKIIVR